MVSAEAVRLYSSSLTKQTLAHEQFSTQVQNVVDSFKKKNIELRKERPVDCHSTLNIAWETLLQETQYDAQAHADAATLLMKNVYSPLIEIASYKKSQSKKLYTFRESFHALVETAEATVRKTHEEYQDSYQLFKSNSQSREAVKYLASYHNTHNEYILQLRASNSLQEEFVDTALPMLLEELEEIHIDLANTLNGAIESHALLLLTKANEQSRRFESILKICKQVNPKTDITCFAVAVSPEPVPYEPTYHKYTPPSDPSIPGSELCALKNELIFDRHTEGSLKARRLALQKEAAELTSYLKQNQDITQTLTNICQRNLAAHLYAKVYETQEDLCRKRNEIRMANLQLSLIRPQIELLSPKQNGTIEMDRNAPSKATNKATIKSMWKKAFKSLKTKEAPMSDKADGGEQSAGTHRKSSRQSSFRKSLLRRKDSKERESDQETNDDHEVDPVYSLLKCAADLPRQHKLGHGHACCMRVQAQNENTPSGRQETCVGSGRNNSRSSSPSSAPQSPPHRRRKKLNIRMKSFSLDAPEPPKPPLMDEAAKRKSTSFTNTCFGDLDGSKLSVATANFLQPSPSQNRRGRLSNRSCSLDIDDGYDSPAVLSGSSQQVSPRSQRRVLPSNNLYVVLFHFRPKEKSDLELRPGARVTAMDTSDRDWWRGKSNGKVGFFPARYVERLKPGERPLQVTHSLQVNDGETDVKLIKDQIVIQTGEEDENGMLPIRTPYKDTMCPLKYLQEIG